MYYLIVLIWHAPLWGFIFVQFFLLHWTCYFYFQFLLSFKFGNIVFILVNMRFAWRLLADTFPSAQNIATQTVSCSTLTWTYVVAGLILCKSFWRCSTLITHSFPGLDSFLSFNKLPFVEQFMETFDQVGEFHFWNIDILNSPKILLYRGY